MYSAIILAAGSGTRLGLGYNKLLYKIDNQSIIEKTVNVFKNDEDCHEIILVISKTDEEEMKKLFDNSVTYVFGGATRQESSYNGVSQATSEIVMIHDGARPYVSKSEIDACKKQMKISDACLLMVPVKDTIKVVENGIVKTTPNRNHLMAALTPQCFKTKLIKECLEKAMKSSETFSDDASVVEKMSDTLVHVVLGEYSNIKITTKEDI
jgi:2-C-methyl-D-erythritol 4-phosphate cytidylyltransferase